MQLWLIRHAHALDAAADNARPVSAKGRAQVKRLARFLRASEDFAPAELWHSELLRAQQTAAQLATSLALKAPLRRVIGLAPDDEPAAIARRLARVTTPLALVGHEPHLSALASLLVTGTARPAVFAMKKCAALALERDGNRWVVRWHIAPALLA